jgi:hypothetical protein
MVDMEKLQVEVSNFSMSMTLSQLCYQKNNLQKNSML